MVEGFRIIYGIPKQSLKSSKSAPRRFGLVYEATTMRRFELHRHEDKVGVSGTGVVGEGVVFSDGHACMRWKTEYSSTVFYDSMDHVERIHCHGGFSKIVWVDA